MIKFEDLRRLALSFPETEEQPHFERTSFRVRNKIFATYDAGHNRTTVKLSEIDQDVFTSGDRSSIYPVGNKWGKKGWTVIEMDLVNRDLLHDAVTTAYCEVAPPGLAAAVRPADPD